MDKIGTVVGLRAQDCPGGGWTGQDRGQERLTVADCLEHGVCGCIYGDAVKLLEACVCKEIYGKGLMAHHPAAFINAIAEEGTKSEAIEWLQRTWNENCELRAALRNAIEEIERLRARVAVLDRCQDRLDCLCRGE
jgi:hypothetical protein